MTRYRAIITAIGCLLIAPFAAGTAKPPSVAQWRAAHEAELVGRLDSLVRIPSIAADPKAVATAADALTAELAARGFAARMLVASSGGAPVALGSLDTPGAKRTVVFYAHYDGQPVDRAEWTSDPFVPVMRRMANGQPQDVDWKTIATPFDPEWRLHGRGVADDKVSIVAFLAAFDALKAAGRKPSVNIRVFWEGEEEEGSPHLATLLGEQADLLKADLWLIGDGPVHQSRTPTLYFGVRGVLGFDATIYGPIRPLHDGHYGNWAPNPAALAARLIADMRDEDGTILIPGVGDAVRVPTTTELAAIQALPRVEDGLIEQLELGRSETGEGLVLSVQRPALNIRGIRAGAVGADAANAIPAEARFSADFRLVPDQTVDGIKAAVESFLDRKGWKVVRETPDRETRLAYPRIIRLDWSPGYAALRTDMGLPAAQAVIAAAKQAAGERPLALVPMMGGSVPLTIFDAALKTPLVGLPIVNHDNNQHAANENLRLGNLWDGIDLYAAMIGGLDW
ncbi:M20/M25/M40 family metallo-hydrolase [Rhizorhabdus dicambivorans]|nr:M20/M25/M40 family metallo-hydrolase [Rhizorhabdus dicambivorans]